MSTAFDDKSPIISFTIPLKKIYFLSSGSALTGHFIFGTQLQLEYFVPKFSFIYVYPSWGAYISWLSRLLFSSKFGKKIGYYFFIDFVLISVFSPSG